MAGEFGLFNYPSPSQVRKSIGRTEHEQAYQTAALPRGRGGVALASQAGQQIGRGLGGLLGGSSPEEEQAMKVQAVNQKIAGMDINMEDDPVKFLKEAAKHYRKAGMIPQAFSLLGKAEEFKLTQAKAKKARSGSDKRSAIAQLQLDRDKAVAENRPSDAKAISARIDKEIKIADNKWTGVLNPMFKFIDKGKPIPKALMTKYKTLMLTGEKPISLELMNALGSMDKKLKAMGLISNVIDLD